VPKIKALRTRAGLTQAEVAKKAKVTVPYLSMLERGRRRSPSIPVLRRLARALGVPVGDLLE
jgi:transcriptional regulator with XRE-family HTH domain